ncbi:MAG: hypothetical protein ACLFR5_01360, partial [Halobacteriales archaeon]
FGQTDSQSEAENPIGVSQYNLRYTASSDASAGVNIDFVRVTLRDGGDKDLTTTTHAVGGSSQYAGNWTSPWFRNDTELNGNPGDVDARITVVDEAGNTYTCDVSRTGGCEETEPSPSGITLSLDSTTLQTGETTTATVTTEDGTDVTSEATITSDDTGVATVSGNTVTGEGAGTATITAEYDGDTDSEELTVNEATPISYSGNPVAEDVDGDGSAEAVRFDITGNVDATFTDMRIQSTGAAAVTGSGDPPWDRGEIYIDATDGGGADMGSNYELGDRVVADGYDTDAFGNTIGDGETATVYLYGFREDGGADADMDGEDVTVEFFFDGYDSESFTFTPETSPPEFTSLTAEVNIQEQQDRLRSAEFSYSLDSSSTVTFSVVGLGSETETGTSGTVTVDPSGQQDLPVTLRGDIQDGECLEIQVPSGTNNGATFDFVADGTEC